eukprot:3935169-Prymnesium_polylepis.1
MRRRGIGPRARYAHHVNDTPAAPRPPPRPFTPCRSTRSPRPPSAARAAAALRAAPLDVPSSHAFSTCRCARRDST